VLLGGGAALLLLAVLATPALIRRLQRRRRLADGAPAALWDELAATAVDLGIGVHPSWTPRQTARQLAGVVSRTEGGPSARAVRRPDSDPAAVDALRRLALAEEASSYARPGTATAGDDRVPAQVKKERGARLRELSHELCVRRWQGKVGSTDTVIVDRPGRGYGDDYTPWLVDAPVGKVVRARAAAVTEEGILAAV